MLPWKPPLQKLNPKLYPLTAEIITPGSHIPNKNDLSVMLERAKVNVDKEHENMTYR